MRRERKSAKIHGRDPWHFGCTQARVTQEGATMMGYTAADTQGTRARLASAMLFRGLSPQALDEIARAAQIRTRAEGAHVLSQGEEGDALFVIASGRAKVVLFGENGREVTLSTLGPGDFVGEMAMLASVPRSANVVALEPMTL